MQYNQQNKIFEALWCAKRCLSREQVGSLVLSGMIAGAATALTGAFILPTLASDEIRSIVGQVIISLGQNLSGCARPSPPLEALRYNCTD